MNELGVCPRAEEMRKACLEGNDWEDWERCATCSVRPFIGFGGLK
jgi:hypothetical protein